MEDDLQQLHSPPEAGSQASILSAALKSLPNTVRSTSTSSTTITALGESSSEAVTSPEGAYHTTRRSLLQALQLSEVLLSALDKTNVSLNDPEMLQGQGPLMAVTKSRLLFFKELVLKSRALEQTALDALTCMGAPATHEAVEAGSLPSGSIAGWMSLAEVRLLAKGPVSSQQAEADRLLQAENTKLLIKVEGLQRQVELLSSSLAAGARTPVAAAAAQSLSPQETRAAGEPSGRGEAKVVTKLRRELEEKEELLVGLRRTLRDVANDRYPIIEERDDLQVKMQTLLQSQARLLEDREALETHNSRVEGQLRRTADRCQELEAYVRSLEAEGGGVLALSSPSRPPMVHRPVPEDSSPVAAVFDSRNSETTVPITAETVAEGEQPRDALPVELEQPRPTITIISPYASRGTTPSFFLWLLSFFLEPHREDEDEEEDAPPVVIV